MNKFRNLKLYYKIFTLIIVALVMLVGVGLVGYLSLNDLSESSEHLHDLNMIVSEVDEIRVNLRATSTYFMEMMITEDRAKKNELNENIKDRTVRDKKEIAKLEKLTLSKENSILFERFKEEFVAYSDGIDKLIELTLADRNKEAYQLYFKQVEGLTDAANNTIIEMGVNAHAEVEKLHTQNVREASKAVMIMAGATIVAAVVLASLGVAIANMITRPVNEIQAVSTRIAGGDLTVEQLRVRSKDEVGKLTESINTMADNIRNLIQEAAGISEKVAASCEEMTSSSTEMMNGIEQVSATTEELASGSSNQAMHVAETLEMITLVNNEAKQIAENSSVMLESSEKANASSSSGVQSVNKAIEQMQAIEGKVSSTAHIVRTVEEKSQEINQILSVINDIAAQTNLLALNAAIEAARAGEHGRGFSVVADEVRKLAEQSSESTNQIANIIQSVQQEANQAGQAMNDVVQEVQVGSEVIDNNGKAFREIARIIEEMVARIAEVAAASQQINERTDQVLQSVENIASISEESSAGSEELAATMEQQSTSMQEINGMAENLASMAEQLNTSIAKFKY